MNITTLELTSTTDICRSFADAFAGYGIDTGAAPLLAMLRRRGFDKSISMAAFDGNDIAAFTFNGRGVIDGVPTAYDTGTGTLPAYRSRGLAKQIFDASIPVLQASGIRQYLLEVLQDNAPAVAVYTGKGFEITRELLCFGQACSDIILTHDSDFQLRHINIDTIATLSDWLDFNPSWQNNFDSLRRAGDDITITGAFCDDRLSGYICFDRVTGDVSQIAVDPAMRRRGIASRMLGYMLGHTCTGRIKVLNVEPSCHSLTEFLRASNIPLTVKQYEMLLRL